MAGCFSWADLVKYKNGKKAIFFCMDCVSIFSEREESRASLCGAAKTAAVWGKK